VCRNLHVASNTILGTPVSALAALVTIFLRIAKPRARINSPPERRTARMSRLRERRGRRRRQGAKQPVDFGPCSDAAPLSTPAALRERAETTCRACLRSSGPHINRRMRSEKGSSAPRAAQNGFSTSRLRGAPFCRSRHRRSEAVRRSAARQKARPYGRRQNASAARQRYARNYPTWRRFPCWSAHPPRPERCACAPAAP
jgi:hypothetical protein